MRTFAIFVFAAGVPLWSRSQVALDESASTRSTSSSFLQGSLGIGWRLDEFDADGKTSFDAGFLVRMNKAVFLTGRFSVRPAQDAYFIQDLFCGSIGLGLRVQSAVLRVSPFGTAEIDYSWYHGKTVLYSYDSNMAVGRISTTSFKTGLALSAGLAIRISSAIGIDLGVRQVLNTSPQPPVSTSIPPAGGVQVWQFPHDIYNQAVFFVQTRIAVL
jgi:hypothetical protein